MAPHSEKRRCKGKIPIPIWVPLPRPCPRNSKMPGSYYIPLPPDYFTWALPPPCHGKLMCHCADNNYCTSSNCQNSQECSKRHPIFCPYDNEEEQGSESQQNIIGEGNDSRSPTDSGINICSSCGATPASDNEGCCATLHGIDSKQVKTSITRKSSTPPLNVLNESNESSVERNVSTCTLPQQQTSACASSSCQTSNKLAKSPSNSLTRRKNSRQRNNKRNTFSSTCSNDSVSSFKPDVPSIERSTCNAKTEYRSKKIDISDNAANLSTKKNEKLGSGRTKDKLSSKSNERIHIQQLPDQFTQARRDRTNESSCCTSTAGSRTSYKLQTDTETSIHEQQRKKSSKASTPPKLSECRCSSKHSKNVPPEKTKGMIKNETIKEDGKKSRKTSSKSSKLSECGCSSSKDLKKQKSSKAVKDMSSTSGNNLKSPVLTNGGDQNEPHRTSSGPRQILESRRSSTKCPMRKSSVLLSSLTQVNKSNCQCKFPPAYKHLSCTGSLSGNCNCTAKQPK